MKELTKFDIGCICLLYGFSIGIAFIKGGLIDYLFNLCISMAFNIWVIRIRKYPKSKDLNSS